MGLHHLNVCAMILQVLYEKNESHDRENESRDHEKKNHDHVALNRENEKKPSEVYLLRYRIDGVISMLVWIALAKNM